MKKYIVYESYISSKNDEDIHYINGESLIDLYQVRSTECIIIRNKRDLIGLDTRNLIELFPRMDGKYPKFYKDK